MAVFQSLPLEIGTLSSESASTLLQSFFQAHKDELGCFLSPGVTHTPKITQPATDPCRDKVDEAITTQDERW